MEFRKNMLKKSYKKNYGVYTAITLASVFFGLSFLFTSVALRVNGGNVFEVLAFRFLFAYLIYKILVLTKIVSVRKEKISVNNKKICILSTLYPILYFLSEVFGVKLTSSSETGLIVALMPVFIALLASVFLKEKLDFIQYIFIIISVLGVLLINLENFSAKGNFLGLGILLTGVFLASVYNILSRSLSQEYTPTEISFFMVRTGAVFFNLVLLISKIKGDKLRFYFVSLQNSYFLISMLYLSIFSSILAFFLVNYSLSKLEAAKVSAFYNLSTVISVAAGVLILKEDFSLLKFAGMLVIITGVFGISVYKKRGGNNEKENYSGL